jgi:hypothetical protein
MLERILLEAPASAQGVSLSSSRLVNTTADGCSVNQAVWQMVEAKYPWIFCIWCGGHVVNLFLKDVGQIGKGVLEIDNDGSDEDYWESSECDVADLVRKTKQLNSHFNKREKARSKLTEETKKQLGLPDGLRVMIPADTRFGLYFISMERLLRLKGSMLSVVNSEEWEKAGFSEGESVKNIIEDASFWREVEQLVDFLWPSMQLLRVCDSQQPTSGRIYELAHTVLEKMGRCRQC